jgi:hypothetical protein
MRFFYAVSYLSGKKTTWGDTNPRTGRLSIACKIFAFDKKIDRDQWVADEKEKIREKKNRRELAYLLGGESVEKRDEIINRLRGVL